MADGLWDCDSNVEVGLAQRADGFPDCLVQSSDILVEILGCIYLLYVCHYRQTATQASGNWEKGSGDRRSTRQVNGRSGAQERGFTNNK